MRGKVGQPRAPKVAPGSQRRARIAHVISLGAGGHAAGRGEQKVRYLLQPDARLSRVEGCVYSLGLEHCRIREEGEEVDEVEVDHRVVERA